MKNLRGLITALVTPFRNDKVDFESLGKLVRQQIQGGVTGFVVNGTTAESPTLSSSEVKEIFDFIRREAGADFPLIMGTGSNSTKATIEATKLAESWGADAALVVVPYYNKPPQRGLEKHFRMVAESTKLPVILYNVPGRTVTALSLETIRNLCQVKNIVGIKEASGNIEFAREIREACGKDFILLSGDDGTYGGFLEAGGDGIISVASHIIPEAFAKWTTASLQGDRGLGSREISRFSKLIDLLFVEANPIPVKKALAVMNILTSAELRAPLVEMDEALAQKLTAEMKAVGL